MVAAAALASCTLLALAIASLHVDAGGRHVLLEVQDIGVGSAPQIAQDFLAPPTPPEGYLYAQQPQPRSFSEGQRISGMAAQQQLATAGEMANPAGAPSYNSGEGMTYTPSTQSGVSDKDQSPDLPASFLDDEKKSKKRMKKLAKLLKRSSKEQDALDVRVKELKEYVEGEVTAIRNNVLELNEAETDQIAAPYHLVEGVR